MPRKVFQYTLYSYLIIKIILSVLLAKLFVKSTNSCQVSIILVLQKNSKPQQESIFEPQKKIPLQLSLSSPFPSDIMGRSSYHWPWISIQFNGLIEHLFPSSHWLIAKAKLVMNLILFSQFLPWVTNEKKLSWCNEFSMCIFSWISKNCILKLHIKVCNWHTYRLMNEWMNFIPGTNKNLQKKL